MPIEQIKPSVYYNGRTYYPTGEQWLMAFALADCEWAMEALKELQDDQDKDNQQDQ